MIIIWFFLITICIFALAFYTRHIIKETNDKIEKIKDDFSNIEHKFYDYEIKVGSLCGIFEKKIEVLEKYLEIEYQPSRMEPPKYVKKGGKNDN